LFGDKIGKLQISCGVIILIISVSSLFFVMPNLFHKINKYCDENCLNPNNSSENCGLWTRLPNCHDDEAPNKTIFGTENRNKLGWCYELSSGRCGEWGLLYFSPALFLFPLTYIALSIAIIYGGLR